MKLDFSDKGIARRMIMVRFYEDEFEEIEKVAKKENRSKGEVVRVLVRAALKELKG